MRIKDHAPLVWGILGSATIKIYIYIIHVNIMC